MTPIVVVGAWGGGTSAVAGALVALGCDGRPPYWAIDDPLTPATWESLRFRDILRASIDPGADRWNVRDRPALVQALTALREELRECTAAPMLKHGLAALALDELHATLAARFVFVFRSLDAIERTRARRGWGRGLGAAGARQIYGAMLTFYLKSSAQILPVRYEDLMRAPEATIAALARFAGLSDVRRERSACATLRAAH